MRTRAYMHTPMIDDAKNMAMHGRDVHPAGVLGLRPHTPDALALLRLQHAPDAHVHVNRIGGRVRTSGRKLKAFINTAALRCL
jgi:hypothetical protein